MFSSILIFSLLRLAYRSPASAAESSPPPHTTTTSLQIIPSFVLPLLGYCSIVADMFSRKTKKEGKPSRKRFNIFKETVDEENMFFHSRLVTKTDGIRLLTVEPAKDSEGTITCKLRDITFAEKPKYEALSYTWGDEIAKKRIYVNGKEFQVGRNLYDALKHLRRVDQPRILWVDAICINQTDIIEKNQQIRMMPFTYNRASQVLIWLGLPLGIEREDLTRLFRLDIGGTNVLDMSHQANLITLCRNPYWRRVWIIQEIGLARRIHIHIGTYNVDWDRFIARVEACERCYDSIPLRFKRQLDNKYSSGHKLQTLIETHRSSLCKEPRDHVYGFIGLAIDCEDRFPIDYNKSLFEVWKDAIMFKTADRDSTQHDLLRFGKTVQDLLGGPRIATRDDIQGEILLHLTAVDRVWDEDYKLVHSIVNGEIAELRVPARIAGRISHLGPSHNEIISVTRKMVQWKSSITRHIPEDQLPSAREESDLFMEVLDNVAEENLKAISSYDRIIAWETTKTPNSLSLRENSLGFNNADSHEASILNEPRLFLLAGTKEIDPSSSAKLGLAPPEAQEGDYVCQIQGITKALVVRKRVGFRIIGTAVLAENKFLARARRDSARPYSTFGIAEFDTIHYEDRIDLCLDVATAYELLN